MTTEEFWKFMLQTHMARGAYAEFFSVHYKWHLKGGSFKMALIVKILMWWLKWPSFKNIIKN